MRALALLLLATAVSAQTPGDVVARIHGNAVTRLEASDGRALMGKVLGVLLEEFAKDEKIDVTREEIAAMNARPEPKMDAETRARLAKIPESELRRSRDEVARSFIRNYKINQALYRKYGGRVIFQQVGPEPLDAYRKFLLDHQKKGSFEIIDKSLAPGFWEYVTNEKMHTFVPEKEAIELMTTAWWLRKEPRKK